MQQVLPVLKLSTGMLGNDGKLSRRGERSLALSTGSKKVDSEPSITSSYIQGIKTIVIKATVVKYRCWIDYSYLSCFQSQTHGSHPRPRSSLRLGCLIGLGLYAITAVETARMPG